MELVSVIIPTYRRPDTLGRAIDSVLCQTYKNIEIIVVDDNGHNTEGQAMTELFMKKYAQNKNVKYIQHEINRKRSAARNTGIDNANGQYITFLDDDDEFLPEKIEKQVARLEQLDSSWGLCYCKYSRYLDGKLILKSVEKKEGSVLIEVLSRNLFIAPGSNILYRREVIEAIGYYNTNISYNEDFLYLATATKKYKMAYADIYGLIVHTHHQAANEMNFLDKTQLYCDTIEEFLHEVSEKGRKEIREMINLQIFRWRLINQRDIKSSFKMLIDKQVTSVKVIRYMSHLVYRACFKRSIGFKYQKYGK